MKTDYTVTKDGAKLVKRLLNISNSHLCAFSLIIAYVFVEVLGLVVSALFSTKDIQVADQTVAYFAPMLTFVGVYAGVVLKRLLGEWCAIDKNIKPSSSNILIFGVLISVIFFSIVDIYPDVVNSSNSIFEAFSLMLGSIYFLAAIFIYRNPHDVVKVSDEVKMKVSTLGKAKYLYVDRARYKVITNIVSTLYLTGVLSIVVSHLSFLFQ